MAINRYDAQITFRDTAGVEAKTVFVKIPVAATPDMAKLLTAATGLQSLSNAGVKAYSLLGWENVAFAGTATPAGLNTIKAAITLQYTVSGVLNTRLMFIPNPGETVVEEVTGQGTRVTEAALTAISVAMTAAAGFAVTAVEGQIVVHGGRTKGSAHGPSIGFLDESRNISWMAIPRPLVTSAAALSTLATAFQTAAVSESRIVYVNHLTITEAMPDQTAGIGLAVVDPDNVLFSSVERRMHCKFSYTISSVRYHMQTIIPAPCYENLEISGRSYKLQESIGDTLAGALSTFLGSTRVLTFEGAKLWDYNVQER